MRDLGALDAIIAAFDSAARILHPALISPILRGEGVAANSDGLAFPIAPDLHGEGGAFSELTMLDRKLAGESGWYLDKGLLLGLVRLIPDGASVGDLGAGSGHYSAFLNATNRYTAHAFDGAESAEQISSGRVRHARLDDPNLWLGQQFDWVMCLEVGEHVPIERERFFVDNIVRHAVKGIVLSWSLHPDEVQGSTVHPNAKRTLAEVERAVIDVAPFFVVDKEAGQTLRELATVPWLRESVTVFRRARGSEGVP